MTKWEEQLEKYYSDYKYNFLVQKFGDYPNPWINYSTKEYTKFIEKEGYVNHREVFYDEIVFDIDMDKDLSTPEAFAEAQNIADDISERLVEDGYSHSVWKTGGSGVHIHLFFPQLFQLNNVENRIMRKLFLKKYGRGYIRPREARGKVQTSYNTLIQLEHARHRKGGYKKILYDFHNGIPNLFDQEIWFDLEEEKERNNFLTKHFKKYRKGEKPEAIVFLENEKFHGLKDGRDRALFILTAYYKQFKDDNELFDYLCEWNKKVLGSYFSKKIIKSKIKSARPCLPISSIIDLFDELGISDKYYKELMT